MQSTIYFVDTETTGLSPDKGARIVELAVVDEFGQVILDTLVQPGVPIPSEATAVHGITDADVSGKPRMEDIWPKLGPLLRGKRVVAYNMAFDQKFFPGKLSESIPCCAMHRFSRFRQDQAKKQLAAKSDGNVKDIKVAYPRHNLAAATQIIGYVWSGDAHRALADTLACRAVWEYLDDNEYPGINVYSGTTGLGGALTNPTETAFSKGSIKKHYPVRFRGRLYDDAEAAYKDHKDTGETPESWVSNQSLMVDILVAKLQQYPQLVQAITERGGSAFLRRCTHVTQSKKPKELLFWEGHGMESTFLRCLRDAWLQVQEIPVQGFLQGMG
jgi:DNA polymerase III epsilon subunit-like protein